MHGPTIKVIIIASEASFLVCSMRGFSIYIHSNSPYPGSLGPGTVRNSETAVLGNIFNLLFYSNTISSINIYSNTISSKNK